MAKKATKNAARKSAARKSAKPATSPNKPTAQPEPTGTTGYGEVEELEGKGIERTVGGATRAEQEVERGSGRLSGYYPPSSQSSAKPLAPAGLEGTVGVGLGAPLADVDQRPLNRGRLRRDRAREEEEDGLLRGPSIRVRATKVGYYNDKRRRVGDVFELRPRRGTFTEVVMDKKTGEPKEIRGITETKEVRKILTAEEQFSETWMEEVDSDAPLKTSTGKEHLQREHDEINRSRMAARRSATDPDAEIGTDLRGGASDDRGFDAAMSERIPHRDAEDDAREIAAPRARHRSTR